MPFADKFNEAAQNAAIRLIEADEWRGCGWLAKLVEQQVRLTLTTSAAITFDAPNMDEADIVRLLEEGRRCDDFSKKSDPAPVFFGQDPAEDGDKSVTAEVSCDNESILTVHSVREEKRDSFESNDFSHVDGYDWRIIVADRLKNHRNSWAEHFVRRPTQEEFENQYRHFEAWTHHVHVNVWVGGEWKTITEEYVPHWSKEKPAESFTTTSEWEEGKGWRIKFWDQRVNRDNFVYFDYKPGGITLQKYHNGKHFAVVEQRPEGI